MISVNLVSLVTILPLLVPHARQAKMGLVSSTSAFAEAQSAVWHGNVELLQQCLARDSTLAVASDAGGRTLLHQAAFEGRVEACTALLRMGADQRAVDELSMRPLDWAVLHSRAPVVKLLAEADSTVASTAAPFAGSLPPVHLAAASGDTATLGALLSSGVTALNDCISAIDLARAMGHDGAAQLLMGQPDPAKPSAKRPASNGPSAGMRGTMRPDDGDHQPDEGDVLAIRDAITHGTMRILTAAELAVSPSAWDAALADSTPLLIKGLGKDWSEMVRDWSASGELRERWGQLRVRAGFSPDALYQRFERVTSVDGEDVLCVLRPPSQEMSFASFIDELHSASAKPSAKPSTESAATSSPKSSASPRSLAAHAAAAAAADDEGGRLEHVAVQQSRTSDLGSLFGQRGSALPPLADSLVRRSTFQLADADSDGDSDGGEAMPPGFHANLWACSPPKLSQLHYDGYDSLLIQLQGSKRFTLIDPTPICGLAPCPATVPAASVMRRGPGRYEIEPLPSADERATYDNFPLVCAGEASRAPLAPLFEHAHLTTVDVHAGDALLLPAFWYHEVDSLCDGPDELNLAVNCWWHCGSAISTRHRILREQLRANPQ